MPDPHGPPVVTKARDLMTWLLERISGFPRTHRFVLGDRIGKLALDILERLLEAAYTRQKLRALRKANLDLERNLLRLQEELRARSWRPGQYTTFEIQEPKRRLISAAPYRDRVVHHALCNMIEPLFDATFIHDTYANRCGNALRQSSGLVYRRICQNPGRWANHRPPLRADGLVLRSFSEEPAPDLIRGGCRAEGG